MQWDTKSSTHNSDVQNLRIMIKLIGYGSCENWDEMKQTVSVCTRYPSPRFKKQTWYTDLNTRLRVGWKTLPNLNFKGKFQSQISKSNLNFKTGIFPVLPGKQGFWEIYSKGKNSESHKAMSWSLDKAISWSKGGTEDFKIVANVLFLSHFVASEEKWAVHTEICLFRSWYTLLHAQNLKPTFEFQTPLSQNSPTGTLELIPFGTNSDLRRNCKLCRNCPSGTSYLLPFGANSDLPWDWKIPGDSFSGIPLCFWLHLGTNSIWRQLRSLLEFPSGTLELIPFGASSELRWNLIFP